MMEEEIVRLGPDQRIVGILSVPPDELRSDGPAVVILNAGIVHRVGPNRIHVRVARELAEAGHLALRFDLSGIGDSAPDPGAESHEQSMLSDVRGAIDFLGSRGCDRVILFGLCSGAHLATACAREDPRVVGTILIDPALPPTMKSVMIKIRARALRPRVWWNLLTGKTSLRRYVDAATGKSARGAEAVGALEYANETLEEIIARKTQLFVIFTGGHNWYSYRDHLRDVFSSIDFADQLRLDHIEESDHVFSLEAAQRRLIAAVLEWTRDTTFRSPAEAVESVEAR